MSRLLSADLSDNGIEEWDVDEAWCAVIGELAAVVDDCNLRCNRLGVQGWCGLLDVLVDRAEAPANTRWDLDNEGVKPEIARALGALLSRCPALHTLDLHDNPALGPEGAELLAPGIATSSSLQTLNLHGCGLGAEGINRLSAAVGRSRSLQTLLLMHNRLTAEGAAAIGHAASESTTLTELDLSFNELGPAGGRALAKGIGKGTALVILRVAANELAVGGAAVLAAALQCTQALRECDARWNNLDEGSKVALRQESEKQQFPMTWVL